MHAMGLFSFYACNGLSCEPLFFRVDIASILSRGFYISANMKKRVSHGDLVTKTFFCNCGPNIFHLDACYNHYSIPFLFHFYFVSISILFGLLRELNNISEKKQK